MRLFSSLLRQIESQPTDLLFWEAVLTEVRDTVLRIGESLSRVHADLLQKGEDERSQELRYWQSLLFERVEAVLRDLYCMAPWLDPELEPELRLNTRDASLASLVADLCRVPETAELPIVYERICTHLLERLHSGNPVYPALRRALEGLLNRLPDAHCHARESIEALERIASRASRLLNAMDFRFLFDRERKLLHIGFDVDAGRLDDSCYDLLASEARTAVFLAIAKGDIPREAWFRLGRKLTAYRGRRTLVSWSGTLFEYLMPLLHLRTWPNTLLHRAMIGAVDVQQLYAAERGIPWGISESAYGARDSRMQYQYRAFGVPQLSANVRSAENVIAPYASLLALMVAPRAATANLRTLVALGCQGRYGFFDSADFSSHGARDGELIRCHMAHHQGMSLLAIDNVLIGNRMHERFHREPLVQAVEFLLQERMPAIVDVINDDDCVAA
jgi:hypothetical protein